MTKYTTFREISDLYLGILTSEHELIKGIEPEYAADILAYITPTRNADLITVDMRIKILMKIVNTDYVGKFNDGRHLTKDMYDEIIENKDAVSRDLFGRFVSTADKIFFVGGSAEKGRYLRGKYIAERDSISEFLDYLESEEACGVLQRLFEEAGLECPSQDTAERMPL